MYCILFCLTTLGENTDVKRKGVAHNLHFIAVFGIRLSSGFVAVKLFHIKLKSIWALGSGIQ